MILPELTRVRQQFRTERIDNVTQAVRDELNASGVRVRSGDEIAIAIGSRGISNIAAIIRETAGWVRERGGRPFIVPAMGSHGGATPEGQRKVLEGYGITEADMGAPIRSSLDVVELERGDAPVPVYMDRHAHEAAGTIVINRIKPHTSFRGPYESGLMKMIAIGLGKHAQALAIHKLGVEGLRDVMPQVARQILSHGNILLGLAIVENALDETMKIAAIPASRTADEEPALLDLARANMPGLPVDRIDILVIDRMGKDISGLGLDPNVIGRLKIRGQPEPATPDIRVIIVRDLSPGSHGNAIGMGLADIITRRLFDKIDVQATYENALTTTFTDRAKVPLIAESDRQAMEFALRATSGSDAAKLRIVRIPSTLHLEELAVSPAVLEQLREQEGIEMLNATGEWFDELGQMWDV